MEIWKLIHVSCALLSVFGFFLRGAWMMLDSRLFQHKLTKVLPHTIDSLLLVSAIVLLVSLNIDPLDHDWVLAKIIALLFYIGLGLVAFRFGKNKGMRFTAWFLALLTVAYIVQTAVTKNPFIF